MPRRYILTVCALVSCMALLDARARARDAASPVAVLPLVVSGASDDYTLVPKAAELRALTTEIRTGMAAARDLAVIPIAREDAGVCSDAACARQIGRTSAAHTVVFGTVQRSAGERWTTQITAVEVRTGRTVDALSFGVTGDYDALLSSERRLGACMRRSIVHKARCKSDLPPQ